MATEVKSSGVGIVLSFFWTGLGQLYAGHVYGRHVRRTANRAYKGFP